MLADLQLLLNLHITACGRRQEADIMFLMDSVNAGKRNTKRSLAFLKTLVEELDIDHDNIHVGLNVNRTTLASA